MIGYDNRIHPHREVLKMFGDWKMLLLNILISVGMGAAWYGLYRLCIRARKIQAQKKGIEPELSTLRDWFLSLGCFMQVVFWVCIVYRR